TVRLLCLRLYPRLVPCSIFFFLMIPRPPRSPLFPYTTLFRSSFSSSSWTAPRLLHSLMMTSRHSALFMIARSAFSLTSFFAACRSEEHTSELQSLTNLVCRLLLEKKNYHIVHCI